MVSNTKATTITVVKLGQFHVGELDAALNLANQCQDCYRFQLHPRTFPLDQDRFSLPNGTLDLERAVLEVLENNDLPRPLVFITTKPFGDYEKRNDPTMIYFSDVSLFSQPEVGIISTFLWDNLAAPGRFSGRRPIQPYLLLEFAQVILGQRIKDLDYHDELSPSVGCLFDFDDTPSDIDLVFEKGHLCQSCEREVRDGIRKNEITLFEVAAARRLFNRGIGRKLCFIAMPFRDRLEKVYTEVITPTLEDLGWTVVRADQISGPRRVTDAIVEGILTSDLVLADATLKNPNVFFEIGFAYAAGREVLPITQHKRLPFDIAQDRAIFYDVSETGLEGLKNAIRRHAAL